MVLRNVDSSVQYFDGCNDICIRSPFDVENPVMNLGRKELSQEQILSLFGTLCHQINTRNEEYVIIARKNDYNVTISIYPVIETA